MRETGSNLIYNFLLQITFFLDREDLLKIVDNSTQLYFEKINILLDTYATLERINKYKLRFKFKPQITLSLQNSISVENKLLTKFINVKHLILKEGTHITHKKNISIRSTLMKKSKQDYYNKCCGTYWNNIKNTWKESNP